MARRRSSRSRRRKWKEQLSGFLVGAEEALVRGDQLTIAGAVVEVLSVDCGPDTRTGLTARVLREGMKHEVALADLEFSSVAGVLT